MSREIPKYYIGKYHGYEARKVVEDFVQQAMIFSKKVSIMN